MDSEQQGAGRDQAEGKAKAKAKVPGVLISLELERRKRGLHLSGRLQRSANRHALEDAEVSLGTRQAAYADIASLDDLADALSVVEKLGRKCSPRDASLAGERVAPSDEGLEAGIERGHARIMRGISRLRKRGAPPHLL